MVGLLGCECTLPGHAELILNQHPKVPLLRAAFNPLIAQSVQDLALGLVELSEVCTGAPLKPAKEGHF